MFWDNIKQNPRKSVLASAAGRDECYTSFQIKSFQIVLYYRDAEYDIFSNFFPRRIVR